MSRLRVGLVGAGGGISGLRGRAIAARPDAEVTLCHQRSEKRMERVRERYPGVPVVREPHALLSSSEVDAVVISTPNTSHYELAKAALENGKHVCVDYPMVQTLEQYDTLVNIAADRGLVLHDGLTPCVENYHLAVKEGLSRIGAPLTAYACYFVGKTGWYWREAEAGNIFVLITIHQLAQLYDLFGPVRTVAGAVSDVPVEGEAVRTVQASFRFANGVTAAIENGWGLPAHPGLVYRVIGSEGMVEFLEDGGAYRLVVRRGGEPVESRELKLDFTATLAEDTNNFLAGVLEGAQPHVPLDLGREILRLCLLAQESASLGRSVGAA